MTIKCIIFDWGNLFTLSDYEIAEKEFNLPKEKIWDLEDKYSTFKDCTGFWKDLQELGVNKTLQAISDIFNTEKICFLDELTELLDQLSGYTLVLFSNQVVDRTKLLREKYPEIISKFHHVFFSDEIGLIKPNVKSFKFVLQQIGAKPEECVFIDDTKVNIESAESLGIHGILFKNPDELKEELTKLGVTF